MQSENESLKNLNLTQNIISFIFWGFGFSLFASKSGLSFFYSLALLLGLSTYFKINTKATLLKVTAFFSPLLLTQFFTQEPLQSMLQTLKSWPMVLSFFVVWLFLYNSTYFKKFAWGLCAGLLVACGYSFYKAFLLAQRVEFFGDLFRVSSFWDVLRWSTFLGAAIITFFSVTINFNNLKLILKTNKNFKYLAPILGLLSFISLILSNSRGALLFTFLSLAFLLVVQVRNYKILFLSFALALSPLALSKTFKDRFMTSFSFLQPQVQKVENNSDKNSSHASASNLGRLNMWHVALDYWFDNKFSPTGFGLYEKPLRNYLAKKETSYLDRYTKVEFSYHDTHNSYLWLLVQLGLFFSIYFWGSVAYILLSRLKYLKKSMSTDPVKLTFLTMCYTLVGYHLMLATVYSNLVSFESITFFMPLSLIALYPSWLNIKKKNI